MSSLGDMHKHGGFQCGDNQFGYLAYLCICFSFLTAIVTSTTGSVVEQQQRQKRLTWIAAGLDCLQGIRSGRRASDHTVLRHHSLQQLRSQHVIKSNKEWHGSSVCSMPHTNKMLWWLESCYSLLKALKACRPTGIR